MNKACVKKNLHRILQMNIRIAKGLHKSFKDVCYFWALYHRTNVLDCLKSSLMHLFVGITKNFSDTFHNLWKEACNLPRGTESSVSEGLN